MKKFLLQELYIANKLHNITKYSLMFYLFSTVTISLVNSHENILEFGLLFSVISTVLSMLHISSYLVKPEIENGVLDQLLVVYLPWQIILAKYISLFTSCIIAFLLHFPFVVILYDLDILLAANFCVSCIILISASSALNLLISVVQCYFQNNTNFLSMLIMPLLIPIIILIGIILEQGNLSLILILFGVAMIIVPLSLKLASYLLENI